MNKVYSQVIRAIKNTINRSLLTNDLATSSQDIHLIVSNRRLLAGYLLEEQNTTISKYGNSSKWRMKLRDNSQEILVGSNQRGQ
ncbi:MAG: hypothetical protein LBI28_00840 [Treponema sp.]|jgi:hypothetical protein|nr:hypothetical protein [Treponema sp.]